MLQNDAAFNLVSDIAMKLAVKLAVRKKSSNLFIFLQASYIEMKIGKTF